MQALYSAVTMNEPAYLLVGTDVSAKYRGAFCEAKIKSVKKLVKVKVLFKQDSSSHVVQDDQIKGCLRIGAAVEIRMSDGTLQEGMISKLTDASWYTVVFDDGDETVLRRSSLRLKGERHFAKSESLDQLPLTHPEHFGTPVLGRKSVKGRRSGLTAGDEKEVAEWSEEDEAERVVADDGTVGHVVCVESSADDKMKGYPLFPALVVSPDCNDEVTVRRDQCLVRSFKDGTFHCVARKDIRVMDRESFPKPEAALKQAFEDALGFLESKESPASWKKDLSSVHQDDSGSESGGDEQTVEHEEEEEAEDESDPEERDNFLQQLYQFMENRGTPINRPPVLCYRRLNLFKLYRLVQKRGGSTGIKSGTTWKQVYKELGVPVLNSAASHNIKSTYRKYLFGFEEYCRSVRIRFRSVEYAMEAEGRQVGRRTARRREAPAPQPDPEEPSAADEAPMSDKREATTTRRRTKASAATVASEEECSDEGAEKKEEEEMDVGNAAVVEEESDKKEEESGIKEEPDGQTVAAVVAATAPVEEMEKLVEVEENDERMETSVAEEASRSESDNNIVTGRLVARAELNATPLRGRRRSGRIPSPGLPKPTKTTETTEACETTETTETTQIAETCETEENKGTSRDVKPNVEMKEERWTGSEGGASSSNGGGGGGGDGGNVGSTATTAVAAEAVDVPDDEDREEDDDEADDDMEDDDGDEMSERSGESDAPGVPSMRAVHHRVDIDEQGDENRDSDGADDLEGYPLGTRLQVKYGRGKTLKVYEASIRKRGVEAGEIIYLVHYFGWNSRYDEWIRADRIIRPIDKNVPKIKHKKKIKHKHDKEEEKGEKLEEKALTPARRGRPPLHAANRVPGSGATRTPSRTLGSGGRGSARSTRSTPTWDSPSHTSEGHLRRHGGRQTATESEKGSNDSGSSMDDSETEEDYSTTGSVSQDGGGSRSSRGPSEGGPDRARYAEDGASAASSEAGTAATDARGSSAESGNANPTEEEEDDDDEDKEEVVTAEVRTQVPALNCACSEAEPTEVVEKADPSDEPAVKNEVRVEAESKTQEEKVQEKVQEKAEEESDVRALDIDDAPDAPSLTEDENSVTLIETSAQVASAKGQEEIESEVSAAKCEKEEDLESKLLCREEFSDILDDKRDSEDERVPCKEEAVQKKTPKEERRGKRKTDQSTVAKTPVKKPRGANLDDEKVNLNSIPSEDAKMPLLEEERENVSDPSDVGPEKPPESGVDESPPKLNKAGGGAKAADQTAQAKQVTSLSCVKKACAEEKRAGEESGVGADAACPSLPVSPAHVRGSSPPKKRVFVSLPQCGVLGLSAGQESPLEVVADEKDSVDEPQADDKVTTEVDTPSAMVTESASTSAHEPEAQIEDAVDVKESGDGVSESAGTRKADEPLNAAQDETSAPSFACADEQEQTTDEDSKNSSGGTEPESRSDTAENEKQDSSPTNGQEAGKQNWEVRDDSGFASAEAETSPPADASAAAPAVAVSTAPPPAASPAAVVVVAAAAATEAAGRPREASPPPPPARETTAMGTSYGRRDVTGASSSSSNTPEPEPPQREMMRGEVVSFKPSFHQVDAVPRGGPAAWGISVRMGSRRRVYVAGQKRAKVGAAAAAAAAAKKPRLSPKHTRNSPRTERHRVGQSSDSEELPQSEPMGGKSAASHGKHAPAGVTSRSTRATRSPPGGSPPSLPLAGTPHGRSGGERGTGERVGRPPRLSLQIELVGMNGAERISFLQERLQEIRTYYLSLKTEVATIDRRRKKLRKREREATKSLTSSESCTGSLSPARPALALELSS
ncbi:uncharacterized protein LOC116948308 isoform X1 [Petromyzon marinus]|uniref:uncharacterized protein LOC116948308 isoform X1 n=2 Tax=Petromyzon marinus TaxID=7757 RepID=UPI003F71666A